MIIENAIGPLKTAVEGLTLEVFDVGLDLEVDLDPALLQSSVESLERVLGQPQPLLGPDPPLPLLLPLGLGRLLLLRHLLHIQTLSQLDAHIYTVCRISYGS